MSCGAKIRPFRPVNDTEVGCEMEHDHTEHSGVLKDYVYPGSETIIRWFQGDRRNFFGEWPGDCDSPGCPLPLGHKGRHA